MTPVIHVKNVSKNFVVDDTNLPALDDVSFDVFPKEFLCLIGPSGCGKSTILRLMADLDKVSSGAIDKPKELKLAMVFQNFALYPWLTVKQNVAFGLEMQKKSKAEIEQRVKAEIQRMGLSSFADKHPKELSGGMRQRVGIARALAIDPDVLLMDEPFSALDAFTAEKLRAELLTIWQERQMTVVMVTHLVDEAIELADRVVVFSPRPGRVKKIKEIKLPRPRLLRSQAFYHNSDAIKHLVVGSDPQD